MQLAEDVLLAQRVLEPTQARLEVGRAQVEQVAAMLGDFPQRRPRLTFRLVGVGVAQEPAEVRVAAEIAGDEDELFAIDLEGAADDRFDPELAARLEVAHRAIDAAPVGDCERRHL